MNQRYDVLVIGGGPAGVTAAMRAGELGSSVALVERGRLGGTCTNDGCVPTRVLAKAARMLRDSAQFADYGLVAQPPELDFAALMRRTQQVVYTMHEKKQLIHNLTDAGVSVFAEAGPARFVNANTVETENGERFEANKIILAAGGRARRIDFPGAELTINHSDLWTLKQLPRSLVIVGGAATGSQVASIFHAFGVEVTILELSPRILPVEDEAVAALVMSEFQKRGLRVIPSMGCIRRIEGGPGSLRIEYGPEGSTAFLEAEAVMLSTGWVGNLDPLNLPAAGIETQGPYVKVDDHLQTTAPNIFAAGDITGRMMLVQSAGTEAVMAVENAILGPERKEKHSIVPHGGFTDPEYGSVGMSEAQAVKQGVDYVTATVPYTDLDRAVIDDRTVGLCKLIVSRENHRILGAHVAGEDALEIVQVIAAGMTADMWVEDMADLEIAYPTFTAVLGLAARRIVAELGVRPLAHSWQALGKPPAAEWERGGN